MTRSDRTDSVLALCASASSLLLYVLTLQPDFGGPEDTPKFQFIGRILGIPHPPGYPLYVLLSHVFTAIPIGTIAYRANLFSAVMASAACGLAYVIGRQLAAHRWSAFCAAIGLAAGASFWRSAVFAEVYSLAAVMAALTIALLLAWDARGGTGRLVAAFGAFAFGLGNHLTIVGIVPAFAAYVLTRGRRIWSARMVLASTAVLALGLAQYGLIIVRTRQHALYLETRAESLRDLVGVVTAERFADQRFAFGVSQLLTDHLPALAMLIAREFGAAGTTMFGLGLIAGFRRANQRLVLGAALGMFVMVLNISGDLKGFITPLMVLLWPVAAVGVDALAHYLRSIRAFSALPARLALAAAVAMPAANLAANYRASDQSGQTADARFLRAVFSQLPHGSALVTGDYWSDMAWRYYFVTGEADTDWRVAKVDFDAASVREQASNGRRVFSLAHAATFFAAEGLHFERTTVAGPPLDQWLASLPRGSVVAGAMAYESFPADLSVIGHPNARSPGRQRAFEAFAAVVREPGVAWRWADDEISVTADRGTLGAPVPEFAHALVASSGARGAKIEHAGRTLAQIDNGGALAVFAPDGTLLRALELRRDDAPRVPYGAALYELKGEAPCASLNVEAWTEVGAVMRGGGWVATLPTAGSVVIETIAPGMHDTAARSAILLGEGSIRTDIARNVDGDAITTTVSRSGETRSVFRLALNRPILKARARLRTGGSLATVNLCAFQAARPLFEAGENAATLRADFESESYFGAGWDDAQRTPTGAVRNGHDGAAIFLPLEPRPYKVSIDLASAGDADVKVSLDGMSLGTCHPGRENPCELPLPAAAVGGGLNTLTFSGAAFTFRGARIVRLP